MNKKALELKEKVTNEKNKLSKGAKTSLLIGLSLILDIGIAKKTTTNGLVKYIEKIKPISKKKLNINYNDETGIYTIINDKDDFKILQLTDIHLGSSTISYNNDIKALKAVYNLINYTKPDLVIVTGDLVFPIGIKSFSLDNSTQVKNFSLFMKNIGIPWAYTYGNHDTDKFTRYSKEKLDDLYKSLSFKTSKNLLYPYIQPKVHGRSNQIIEIRNDDGKLNQALFLIDSNSYVDKKFYKYDYIRNNQVDWYKENIIKYQKSEGKNISSLVFFHIPLKEYKTAYELYQKGSSEVKYYFGSNDEKMYDKVCCSDHPSKLFNVAVELKSTKGFFCGHDHYNNMSLEYKGIRLTYGMSIDYLAMPGISRDTKQRGATLITTHKDSSVDIKQIPLSLIQKRDC